MVEKAVTFDVAAFHAAYKAELPVNLERVNDKLTKSHSAMGLMSTPTLGSISDLQGTFCDNWPKIRGLINLLLKFSWLVPGSAPIAAQVKAFLAAMSKAVIPAICGTQEPTP